MVNKCQRSKGDLVKLLITLAAGCRKSILVWRAPVITLLSNSKRPITLGKGFFSHVKGKGRHIITRESINSIRRGMSESSYGIGGREVEGVCPSANTEEYFKKNKHHQN